MQTNAYSIMDFGAIGDNETLNTKAFSNAISSAFDNGGGVVYVTSGTSGASLKSRNGAVLCASLK